MREAQSEFIALLLIALIIAVILIPLAYYLSDYASQGNKQTSQAGFIAQKINGAGVILYFNASNSPRLEVIPNVPNLTLVAVFVGTPQGYWQNVTSSVYPLSRNSPQPLALPQPMIYNFSLPGSALGRPVLLEVSGFNTTLFAVVEPDQSALVG